MQKRVAAIHDISCFGKCSLTVALPMLSAAGIETLVIPTAVLSTHTGGFTGYTFKDLTDEILPVCEHWQSQGISVDAVYSGYLGSKEQIGIVAKSIEMIKKQGGLVYVDPVMADRGKLYAGFPEDFPKEMLELCKCADIIVPNMTEACLLLGIPFEEGPYTREYIEHIVCSLSELTGAKVVLTGVYFDDKVIGAACYENGKTEIILSDLIKAFYHGTGDVFASALLSGLMNGKTLAESTRLAVDFTCACILTTNKNHPGMRYGVAFEEKIPYLLELLV